MSYKNEPLKLVVSTKVESYEFGTATAELVYEQDGSVYHFRCERYGPEVKYQGLQITAQRNLRGTGSEDTPSWYAWSEYGGCPVKYYGDGANYGSNASMLVLQLKTIRAIEKKWAAMDDSMGTCRRFSDAVVRFGSIIGVEGFGWNDGTKSNMTGEWYRWTNASGLISHLDALETFG
jgi:hypothetical protein